MDKTWPPEAGSFIHAPTPPPRGVLASGPPKPGHCKPGHCKIQVERTKERKMFRPAATGFLAVPVWVFTSVPAYGALRSPRARPERLSAGVRASFCSSFWRRGAGERAERNEKHSEHETKSTVEVGPCTQTSWYPDLAFVDFCRRGLFSEVFGFFRGLSGAFGGS